MNFKNIYLIRGYKRKFKLFFYQNNTGIIKLGTHMIKKIYDIG